jgi:hypothetical protein
VASTVNMVGTTMSGVALAFAVLSISDSPSALGYVLAASTVPTVLFLLFGGVVATGCRSPSCSGSGCSSPG